MSAADEAVKWLDGRQDEIESAIAALVNINSYTDNPGGGRQVGALLRELYASAGLEAAVVESHRYADHLVFRSKASAPNKGAIALVGHLDTVFPPGTFEAYRRDGELGRGPGVLDMKGGLVVVGFAIRALAQTIGLDAIAPLRIVVVADEEVGSPEGQQVIAASVSGAQAALVFEAGRKGDAIITSRKGTGGMTAVATGKAAHAGANHQDGVNAIWAMAAFIERIQALTDYDRGVTINVGKVSGGQGKNTVPDHAEAMFDLRFVSTSDAEATVYAITQAAREAEARVPGSAIVLSGGVARKPLERSPQNVTLFETYARCAKESGLGFTEAALIGGGSDASTTSALGIASIDGLGPRGSGFHTKDELIELSSLVPKAQALVRMLVKLSEGHRG